MRKRTNKANERRQMILDYVKSYHRKNGFSPSMAEIATRLQTSKSVVTFYLDQLQSDGLLKREQGIARSIVLLGR